VNNVDYATQSLIEELTKSLGEICEAIKDTYHEIERLNENIENITGTFKGNTFLNVVASIHEN
jgi:peptidoglycan hydrolase CwlO-like protein